MESRYLCSFSYWLQAQFATKKSTRANASAILMKVPLSVRFCQAVEDTPKLKVRLGYIAGYS